MIFRARWLRSVIGAAVAALLVTGSAFAQQPGSTVAKLKDAEGNVLVSQGDAMVAGANDQRLAVGTRVVTTGGAKVTISYDVGCDVRLKENERFTVTLGPCAVLLTQVESLGPAAGAIGGGTAGTAPVAGATAGGGAAGTAGAVGVAGTALIISGAITGVGIYELTRKTPISPH
jgi:hypothetical protein